MRALFACSLLAAVALLSGGCTTLYVDNALKDVSVQQVRKPARLQDAQLLFTFQSKGTANAKVTEHLKTQVTEIVNTSGLFATVGPDPSLSGAVLNITINNVPVTDAVFAKGFATGLTFGLVGSAVTDGYVCTVDYLTPRGSKISKTNRHAIHATLGAKSAPKNGIKAKNAEDAVRTMTQQVVAAGLRDLSRDQVFQ